MSEENKGRFIVLEGIDGAGTSTQIFRVAEHAWERDKYRRMLITHEPTIRAKKIRAELEASGDAFSGGEELARLYTDDRRIHCELDIAPAIAVGQDVLSDRYSLSTICYQQTQGVDLDNLVALHESTSIIVPDVTYFIDVSAKTALERMQNADRSREKFEEPAFLEQLVDTYREMYELNTVDDTLFGPCVYIDGECSIKEVTAQITSDFDTRFSYHNA